MRAQKLLFLVECVKLQMWDHEKWDHHISLGSRRDHETKKQAVTFQ